MRADGPAVDVATVPAPFGSLLLHADPEALIAVDLYLEVGSEEQIAATPLLHEAARQFAAYFRNGAFRFSLPLRLRGTEYQRRVWQQLMAIPAGTSCRYGDLAAGLSSGPRAVAAACRANPLPLIIPCHRVVAGHGLGGYCGRVTGPWVEVKQWLLQHERIAPGCRH